MQRYSVWLDTPIAADDGRFVLYADHLAALAKKEAEIAALQKQVAYLENKDEQWRGLCESCPEIAALKERVKEMERDTREEIRSAAIEQRWSDRNNADGVKRGSY